MWDHEKKLVFLRVYRESVRSKADNRLGACEAAETEWENVVDWLRKDKEFRKAYDRIQSEGLVNLEDQIRVDARNGNKDSLKMVLRAEDPEKYGSKLKVTHSGNISVTRDDVNEFGMEWLVRSFNTTVTETKAIPESVESKDADS